VYILSPRKKKKPAPIVEKVLLIYPDINVKSKNVLKAHQMKNLKSKEE
jgi:hypothetical protein